VGGGRRKAVLVTKKHFYLAVGKGRGFEGLCISLFHAVYIYKNFRKIWSVSAE